MFKNKKKKGFTLVELIVVIAVIAVLAGVSIPAYFYITNQAKQSADEQAVDQMNTLAQISSIESGEVSDKEILNILNEEGYNTTSLKTTYSGTAMYYDHDLNKILYVEKSSGDVLFPAAYEGQNINTDLKSHTMMNMDESFYCDFSDVDSLDPIGNGNTMTLVGGKAKNVVGPYIINNALPNYSYTIEFDLNIDDSDTYLALSYCNTKGDSWVWNGATYFSSYNFYNDTPNINSYRLLIGNNGYVAFNGDDGFKAVTSKDINTYNEGGSHANLHFTNTYKFGSGNKIQSNWTVTTELGNEIYSVTFTTASEVTSSTEVGVSFCTYGSPKLTGTASSNTLIYAEQGTVLIDNLYYCSSRLAVIA